MDNLRELSLRGNRFIDDALAVIAAHMYAWMSLCSYGVSHCTREKRFWKLLCISVKRRDIGQTANTSYTV